MNTVDMVIWWYFDDVDSTHRSNNLDNNPKSHLVILHLTKKIENEIKSNFDYLYWHHKIDKYIEECDSYLICDKLNEN